MTLILYGLMSLYVNGKILIFQYIHNTLEIESQYYYYNRINNYNTIYFLAILICIEPLSSYYIILLFRFHLKTTSHLENFDYNYNQKYIYI